MLGFKLCRIQCDIKETPTKFLVLMTLCCNSSASLTDFEAYEISAANNTEPSQCAPGDFRISYFGYSHKDTQDPTVDRWEVPFDYYVSFAMFAERDIRQMRPVWLSRDVRAPIFGPREKPCLHPWSRGMANIDLFFYPPSSPNYLGISRGRAGFISEDRVIVPHDCEGTVKKKPANIHVNFKYQSDNLADDEKEVDFVIQEFFIDCEVVPEEDTEKNGGCFPRPQ